MRLMWHLVRLCGLVLLPVYIFYGCATDDGPKRPDHDYIKYIEHLDNALEVLGEPELNPDELKNIVVSLKIAEQKKEVFMGIFGLGGYQLSTDGR
ncbi:hypothetical protein QUF75_17820, partial [Desulfococcaceae bacterium HSG7]|nr:hypothetical protein [Desulfococcaceae bacterium HSG7]